MVVPIDALVEHLRQELDIDEGARLEAQEHHLDLAYPLTARCYAVVAIVL